MLIEFPTGPEPPLARGDSLEVLLQTPHEQTRVQAEVMRCEGNAFGLAFPGSVRGGRLDPPPALDAIVRALDRHRWPACPAAAPQQVGSGQPI
jgi:hypothetical protein